MLEVAVVEVDDPERESYLHEHLLQAHLLVYGLFRWASRGLFFGELRHSLNVDVDDWFNSSDELLPNGAAGVMTNARVRVECDAACWVE